MDQFHGSTSPRPARPSPWVVSHFIDPVVCSGEGGVHPKVAKELARHSTIALTMDRYTHVELDEMARGVNSLEGGGDLVAPMVAIKPVQPGNTQELSQISAQQKTPQKAGFEERRRPDSNRGWRICNPLP